MLAFLDACISSSRTTSFTTSDGVGDKSYGAGEVAVAPALAAFSIAFKVASSAAMTVWEFSTVTRRSTVDVTKS